MITASDAGQYALESETWQNGAFTYVLREALEDRKADRNSDRRITVSELSEYVTSRVAELTSGAQTPQQKRENPEFDPVLVEW